MCTRPYPCYPSSAAYVPDLHSFGAVQSDRQRVQHRASSRSRLDTHLHCIRPSYVVTYNPAKCHFNHLNPCRTSITHKLPPNRPIREGAHGAADRRRARVRPARMPLEVERREPWVVRLTRGGHGRGARQLAHVREVLGVGDEREVQLDGAERLIKRVVEEGRVVRAQTRFGERAVLWGERRES